MKRKADKPKVSPRHREAVIQIALGLNRLRERRVRVDKEIEKLQDELDDAILAGAGHTNCQCSLCGNLHHDPAQEGK